MISDRVPIRCAWPSVFYGKWLTDRKIERYQRQGYYSSEFRAFRKERMEKKAAKRASKELREGNFRRMEDGRMIYDPR